MNCTTDMHVLLLSIIIILVGSLAGLTNYLTYYFSDNEEKKKYEVIKYIVGGIGAAILVPLLLNMLSSNLIKNSGDYDNINYFVFAGFCFVAGYFSDRFINSMGEKILRDLEKTNAKVDKAITSVKENEEKIDFIVSSESEDAEVGEINVDELKAISPFADENMRTQLDKIIQSLAGKFRFRTSNGISKDLKYSPFLVETILEQLQGAGIVKKLGKDDKELWALTKVGSDLINKKKNEETS